MQNTGTANSHPITQPPTKPLDSSSCQDASSVEFVGLVLQLADGTIQACNAAAERLLDMTFEQIQNCTEIGRPWQISAQDSLEGNPTKQQYPARVALQTGQPSSNILMEFHKPNRDRIQLQVTAQPLFQANASVPYAVVTTFTEVASVELPSSKTALAATSASTREAQSKTEQTEVRVSPTLPQIVLYVDDNDTNLYITSRIPSTSEF